MAAKASAALGGAMTVPDSAETDELEAAFALATDEADVAVPEVEEQALSASAPTAATADNRTRVDAGVFM